MYGRVRRTLEMGTRVREFARDNPDTSAGYTATLARLEERLAHAEQVAAQQRAGVAAERAANRRKREIRATMVRTLLDHLRAVAALASKEDPTLPEQFELPVERSYHALRTAAVGMLEAARARQELLVRNGLAEPVLDALEQSLREFDAALGQGAAGRYARVGARADLAVTAGDIVELVNVLDGYNRFRFLANPDRLAAWASACNIVGPFRSNGEHQAPDGSTDGGTPPEGQVKPAA